MKIEIIEFWAVIVLLIAYITAAFMRRGAGEAYRKGLFQFSIAFFMMEVVPPFLNLIVLNTEDKKPTDLLQILALIAVIVAVLFFLNSLRLLCGALLGESLKS
jgi:hypothetical protein